MSVHFTTPSSLIIQYQKTVLNHLFFVSTFVKGEPEDSNDEDAEQRKDTLQGLLCLSISLSIHLSIIISIYLSIVLCYTSTIILM